MGWLLIILSLLVLWIASLCKILYTSILPSKTSFLSNGGDLGKKNVLLVVAHPDDESMFFSPTINHLISRGHNLHILCLSIGNADGIGNVRKHELYKACVVLKVPLQKVKVLDHSDLQDGFDQVWDHKLLAKIIEEEVSSHGIDVIVTFDNYGVSGHCNHCDVHYGVRKLVHENSRSIEAWELCVKCNILPPGCLVGPLPVHHRTAAVITVRGGRKNLSAQNWQSSHRQARNSTRISNPESICGDTVLVCRIWPDSPLAPLLMAVSSSMLHSRNRRRKSVHQEKTSRSAPSP